MQEDIPAHIAEEAVIETVHLDENLAITIEKVIDTVQVFVRENVRMQVTLGHRIMPDGSVMGWMEEKTLEIFDRNIKALPLISQHDMEIEELAPFTILALQAEDNTRDENTEQESGEPAKDLSHVDTQGLTIIMQADEELGAPVLKRQPVEASHNISRLTHGKRH